MALLHKCFFGLIGIGAALGVTQHVQQLRKMQLPSSQYRQAEGVVQRVSQWNAGTAGEFMLVYHVDYVYRDGSQQHAGDRLSTTCGDCPGEDVLHMTGRTPQQLSAGSAVRVYVLKERPHEAYLALATPGDIREKQWAIMRNLIVILIAFCLAIFMDRGKRAEAS
jgi:hypothetical protein